MRIAFLTTEYITEDNYAGGLAHYLQRVAVGLIKKGHEVLIFVLSKKDNSLKQDGVLVKRVKFTNFYSKLPLVRKFPRTINTLLGSYKLMSAVLKEHRRNKIDIVQAADYKATGYFLTKSRRIPVVTRISYFAPAWRAANGLASYLDEAISERLELISIRNSLAAYAPCTSISRYIKMHEPLDIDEKRPPYTYIYEKLDYKIFDDSLKGINYLLYFGSIMKLKGIEFIKHNLERIFRENHSIHFLFIGRFSNEKIIKDFAPSYSTRIHYINSLRKSQLIPFIQNARCVILPSKIDNLPNTCLESMALKKVVITTHESGFGDIIKNRKNGFIINYGDNDQFCRTINKICKMDNSELTSIGSQAKKTIENEFSEEKNIKLLVKYFEDKIFRYRKNSVL